MFFERKVDLELMPLAHEMFARIFPNEQLPVIENGLNCFELSLDSTSMSYYIHYLRTKGMDSPKPVGLSGIYTEKADPTSAWLGWFGVIEEFRRMRIGTRIFNRFLERAANSGFSHARLYTTADNAAARKFYSCMGMTEEEYHGYTPDFVGGKAIIYSMALGKDSVYVPWGDKELVF